MNKRPRKHIQLTRLLICIVIGLITSVGVAWLATVSFGVSSFWGSSQLYHTGPRMGNSGYRQLRGNTYVIHYKLDYRDRIIATTFKRGPWWSKVLRTPAEYTEFTNAALEEAWGWPMVCMVSVSRRERGGGPAWTVYSGVPFGTRTQPIVGSRILPIQPLWIGLFVNTSLYAIVTWLLIVGRVRLRNSIRRKRGLCIRCRYKVLDLPVCPECGSEVGTK